MDRRIIVASLCLLPFTPRLALAQDSGAMPAAGGFDRTHLEKTQMVGSLSLETSRMALEKTKNKWIKQFAEFEVAEQETIADVLKAMTEPQMTASTATTATSGRPEDHAAASLDPQAAVKADKLSKATGTDFDHQYLALQTDGHQQLLQIQEALLKAGSAPREQIGIAKLARGQIKEHLALLQQIQSMRG
jgi:putative membrane protein